MPKGRPSSGLRIFPSPSLTNVAMCFLNHSMSVGAMSFFDEHHQSGTQGSLAAAGKADSAPEVGVFFNPLNHISLQPGDIAQLCSDPQHECSVPVGSTSKDAAKCASKISGGGGKRGKQDGLVVKELATQVGGPEFRSPEPM